MCSSCVPFIPAPIDDAAPYVEHSLALTGLGVRGLLVAFSLIPTKDSSVSVVVREVERTMHRSTSEEILMLCRSAVERWKAYSVRLDSLLGTFEIRDPRSFIDAAWPCLREFGTTDGAIIAACWLIQDRIEIYSE